MACRIDGAWVHVFERAPTADVPDDQAQTFRAGGSLERIDFVTGGGTSVPGCDVVVVVTDIYFVIAPASARLGRLTPLIGRPIRKPVAASPTVSYLDEQCTVSPIGQ